MSERFGKYQVVRQIGSGGLGAVYEARDPVIQRSVAIKTCHTQDEDVRARFLQEAQLAGNLHHRNLTTIYDVGSEGATLYLVCEFLTGQDLDKIEAHRSLPLAERVEILIGIAYGLAHAHDAGVVHRDIKPPNVRVLPDGTVKIMDSGIAKSMYAERTLTRAGLTLGTASYLAPEQVRGEAVDRRTDIFSFGVLAYELLAQRRPFTGSNPAAILDAIANQQPEPLSAAAPDVPPALSSLVDRAMSKQPAERYNSRGTIRRELLEIRAALLGLELAPDSGTVPSSHEVAPADPARARTHPARLPITALLVLAIIAAILTWLLTRSSP